MESIGRVWRWSAVALIAVNSIPLYGVMVVLVVAKIGLDVRAHLREHTRFHFGNHNAKLIL